MEKNQGGLEVSALCASVALCLFGLDQYYCTVPFGKVCYLQWSKNGTEKARKGMVINSFACVGRSNLAEINPSTSR